jgi:hypothetical protein
MNDNTTRELLAMFEMSVVMRYQAFTRYALESDEEAATDYTRAQTRLENLRIEILSRVYS